MQGGLTKACKGIFGQNYKNSVSDLIQIVFAMSDEAFLYCVYLYQQGRTDVFPEISMSKFRKVDS